MTQTVEDVQRATEFGDEPTVADHEGDEPKENLR